MQDFFPFIHEKPKKKENEPQSLYLELDIITQQIEEKAPEKDEETSHIIIIEL